MPNENETATPEPIIIDSHVTLEEAIAHCQAMPPPAEVVDRQRLIDVQYYSFDGNLHQGQYVVDVDLVDDVAQAFKLIKQTHFPVHLVSPLSTSIETSVGFFYRKVAGRDQLSNHALGRAIDINPPVNPYIRDDFRKPEGVEYDPTVPGTLTENGPVVTFFKQRGWQWGGDCWPDRKDYMHFQKLTDQS